MTEIHAFDPDGTPSPGAQIALDGAVAAIPEATTSAAGLMSPADQVRLAAPGIYAADYGATGDGVTDDSAALTAACAAAEGKVLHLTAGATYAIRSKVVLSDGVTVEGHGATLVKPHDSTDNLALTKASNGAGYGAGGRNITIRDLSIVGNYFAPSGYGDCTSWFHHVSGLTIERCHFSQGVINGHYLDLGGCENVTVRDSVFEGANPIPGREYVEAIQVDSSTYAGSSDKGEPASSYDGLPTRAVTVSRCEFRTISIGGTEYPMPSPFGNHGNALTTDDGYYADLAFVDNLVRGWTRETQHSYAGWLVFSGVHGGIIARNRFVYTGPPNANSRGVISLRRATEAIPRDQVAVASPTQESTDRPCVNVSVAGNTFTGFESYWTGASGDSWGFIDLRGGGAPAGIDFTGNRIAACNGTAIRVAGGNAAPVIVASNSISARLGVRAVSTRVIVQGNSLTGAQSPTVAIHTSGVNAPIQCASNMAGWFPEGIVVESADNGLVQGNFVDYYTVAGVRVGSAAGPTAFDVTVSGNRMRAPERTGSTVALHIAATSVRAMRFGNRTREGGSIVDDGTGTITAATDQTV